MIFIFLPCFLHFPVQIKDLLENLLYEFLLTYSCVVAPRANKHHESSRIQNFTIILRICWTLRFTKIYIQLPTRFMVGCGPLGSQQRTRYCFKFKMALFFSFLISGITVSNNTNNLKPFIYSPSQLRLDTRTFMYATPTFFNLSVPSCYLSTAAFKDCYSELTADIQR